MPLLLPVNSCSLSRFLQIIMDSVGLKHAKEDNPSLLIIQIREGSLHTL